ncbi:hypothetical protein GTY54_20625, partial [Streptomyces sp. SID625]|nr:hypothetical protein [Streptomyces sp. SID625]
MREHHHRHFDGDLLFFTAAAPRAENWLTREAWRPHIGGALDNHDLDCTHPQLLREHHLDTVASVLSARLKEITA